MVELGVEFSKDVVLTGNGGISQDLIPQVAQILEDTFKFEGLTEKGNNGNQYKNLIINSDVENVKPFLDSEPKMRQEKKRIQDSYRDKYVYIVQYSKVVDNRLRDTVLGLEQRIKELDIEDPEIIKQVESLKYLGLPDIDSKIAARFTSSRFNPAVMKEQLIGQIYAVKMGEPDHIGVVMPKTIFEWSHNFLKKWREKHVYEMPAWHMLLEDIVRRNGTGANSIIIDHPHAPKEGLEKS